MSMMTENYCDECDTVVHAVFDETDFHNHKVGTIRCPVCGETIFPCNECETRDNCSHCPWLQTPATEAMSDEAYVRYERAVNPKLFDLFRNGDMGEVYQKVALKIEKEESERK